jgi:hypothetical protein
MPASYPFDPTGLAATNKVTNELHTLSEVNASPYRVIIPQFAPFYLDNIQLEHIQENGTVRPLQEDVDFYCSMFFIGASRSIGKMLYGGLAINSSLINGTIRIKQYQTLGGNWVADRNYVLEAIANLVYNPRVIAWDMITNVQQTFPPINHQQDFSTIVGQEQVVQSLDGIAAAVLQGPDQQPLIIKHLNDKETNPHEVNALQVGLGNVPNWEQATDQEVLDLVESDKFVSLRQIKILLRSLNVIP